MKTVIIATPAFGGSITLHYMDSLLKTVHEMASRFMPYATHFKENESLIPRARNHHAHVALKNNVDTLVFIDADISWQKEDFFALVNSHKPVVGGTYFRKSFPLQLNFNPTLEHAEQFFNGGPDRSPELFENFKANCSDIEANGEVQVNHVPTGFLKIDLDVLKTLAEKVPKYRYDTGVEGSEVELHADLFPTGIRNGAYMSEDWGFCELCREHNIPIFLNTKIVVDHTGSTYKYSYSDLELNK